MEGEIYYMTYDDNANVIMYVRTSEGEKKKVVKKGFKPYFYIRENDNINHPGIVRIESGYVSFYGERLKKVIVKHPKLVSELREKVKRDWEADIPFVRRYLIDNGIYTGITFENSLILPAEVVVEPRVLYLDIEVYSKDERFPVPDLAKYPVVIITAFDSYAKKFTTFALTGRRQYSIIKKYDYDLLLLEFTNESEMLSAFAELLNHLQPDVIAGWNIEFDTNYLYNRMRKLNIKMPERSWSVFDMLEAYASVTRRFSNRLKDVVVEEGFISSDELVAEEWRSKLWEENKMKAIDYNIDDVYFLTKIDEKYTLIDFFQDIRRHIGMEELAMYKMQNTILIDTLLLRIARKQGVVLPSKYKKSKKHYKGAIVFKPPFGLFENVAVFDLSRYYPSIILAWGLSPERKNGILCSLVSYLMQLRNKYDAQLKELQPGTKEYEIMKRKRNVAKFLLNAVYGFVAYQHSRIFKEEVAAKVTEIGRKGIMFLADNMKKYGKRVLYGDTDSIMIQVKDMEEIKEVEKMLNNLLVEYCKINGVKALLRIKYEKLFRRVLYTGVKKRYAGWVVNEGWKDADYILVKGFETVRGDTSRLTRKIQRDILELGLKGRKDEIRKYLRDVLSRINEYDIEDLAIRKTIHKRPEEYPNQNWVRAMLYSQRYLGIKFVPGDIVKFIYVKRMPRGYPPTDMIAFLDKSQLPDGIVLDYRTIVEKTIMKKIENILKAMGVMIHFRIT